MAFRWFKMLQTGRPKPLERLYQGPLDPHLMRDMRRLSEMVAQLVSEQVDLATPPFPRIEQAAGLAARLRSYQQLWLSLTPHARKDLRRAAIKNLSVLGAERVQIQALLLNRVSRGDDAAPAWVEMMRRRGWSVLPWRAAIGLAEAPEHDADAAWVRRFDLDQSLAAAAGESGLGRMARELGAPTRKARREAASALEAVYLRAQGDFETSFRSAARLGMKSGVLDNRLDAGVGALDRALSIARTRAPRLGAIWARRWREAHGAAAWFDRFETRLEAPSFTTAEARMKVLACLDMLHPRARKSAEALIRSGWLHQPEGRGGGFTTPVLFNHKMEDDFGPLVHAPHDGTIQSARTLAHELAHGVHADMSRRKGPLLADAGWALSETIALTCETLLLRDHPVSLSAQDFFMLAHQPAIALFERELAKAETEACVDDIWIDALRALYGPDISLDGYRSFWRRRTATISSPGYAVAYVLGWALAQHVGAKLTSGDEETREALFDVLKAGGEMGYEDAAARFGVEDIGRMLNAAYDVAERRLIGKDA